MRRTRSLLAVLAWGAGGVALGQGVPVAPAPTDFPVIGPGVVVLPSLAARDQPGPTGQHPAAPTKPAVPATPTAPAAPPASAAPAAPATPGQPPAAAADQGQAAPTLESLAKTVETLGKNLTVVT